VGWLDDEEWLVDACSAELGGEWAAAGSVGGDAGCDGFEADYGGEEDAVACSGLAEGM